MKKIAALVVAFAALSSSQPALADDTCVGTVNSVYVTVGGEVVLRGSWNGVYRQICNVKQTWKSVTPDVCANWKAMADAAVSMGRIMNIYYYGAVDCAAMPGDAPSAYYVMMN